MSRSVGQWSEKEDNCPVELEIRPMFSVGERSSLNESSLVKYRDEICAVYWINENQLVLYRKCGPYTVNFNDPLLAIPTDADRLAHRLMG
jgi:hypothetical protein